MMPPTLHNLRWSPVALLYVFLLACGGNDAGNEESLNEHDEAAVEYCHDQQSGAHCLELAGCVWSGQSCRDLNSDGEDISGAVPGEFSGAVLGVDGSDSAQLVLVNDEEEIFGALEVEWEGEQYVFPVRGGDEEEGFRFSVRLYPPSCTSSAQLCTSLQGADPVLPVAWLQGLWDSQAVALSITELTQQLADLTFLGFWFEPNDGFKPVFNPRPTDHFVGGAVGFAARDGAFAKLSDCLLTFTDGDDFADVVPEELSCEEFGALNGDQGIDRESYGWNPHRETMWFLIDSSAGAYLMVAHLSNVGLAGVIARPDVWQEGEPLALSQIEDQDILGTFLFYMERQE